MSIVFAVLLLFFIIITTFFAISTSVLSASLHPDELKALEEIATTLGVKGLDLSYNGGPCNTKSLKMIQKVSVVWNADVIENTIGCNCSFNNNMTCHITSIQLKTLSLPGKLPPELAKLRYLTMIYLCRNYLSGPIPMEWATMPYLTFISLCANNLSGTLPRGLQNFKNLQFIVLEDNKFSGPIPDELGNLTNLKGLQLGSNQFTGSLPTTFARLVNLENLHLFGSGLKGPIPHAVARLENLTDLRISDMTGINSFPNIANKAIKTLYLFINDLFLVLRFDSVGKSSN